MTDFLMLVSYAILASLWVVYVTDGDAEQLRPFMSGMIVASIGTGLAAFLAKRRRDGR